MCLNKFWLMAPHPQSGLERPEKPCCNKSMIRNLILFSLLQLAALSSFATIKTVQVVDGTASAVDVQTTNSSGTGATGGTTTTSVSTYTIYGGYTGAQGECTSPASNSSTCDSCIGTGAPTDICTTQPYSCDNRSIHPNLNLAITMSMDPLPNGPTVRVEVASTTAGGTSGSQVIPVDASSTVPSGAGGTFTVYIPWKNICSAIGNITNCGDPAAVAASGATADINVGLMDSSGSSLAAGNFQKFTIKFRYLPGGVNRTLAPSQSPDSTAQPGFSDFRVFPGDSKVYLSEIYRGGVGPTSDNSGVKWRSVRVYYDEFTGNANYCSINPSTAGYADLDVVDKTQVKTSLSQDHLQGLSNDVNYMFTIASVDEAGIVSEFLNLTPPAGKDTEYAGYYTAEPGEVVGLLDKHKCFIATAAFGSPMEPHVELLRNFRDRILSHFTLGKKFIRFYYKNSPPYAEFIAQHDSLRAVVRGILWPIIFFADISLQWGVWAAFALYAAAIGLMIVVVQRLRNRRNA